MATYSENYPSQAENKADKKDDAYREEFAQLATSITHQELLDKNVDVDTVVSYIYFGLKEYLKKHPKGGRIKTIKVNSKGVCTSTDKDVDRKVYPRSFGPMRHPHDMSIQMGSSGPLLEGRYVLGAEGTCGIMRELAAAFAPDKDLGHFEATQKTYLPNNPMPIDR